MVQTVGHGCSGRAPPPVGRAQVHEQDRAGLEQYGEYYHRSYPKAVSQLPGTGGFSTCGIWNGEIWHQFLN